MTAEAGDRTAQILSKSKMADEVGASIHVGGWFDPRGAAIHPLNYVRGLANALQKRGVPIFVRSPVRRLVEEPDAIRLELPGGTIAARQVVIATNAYTDATGFAPHGLERRIVAVNTSRDLHQSDRRQSGGRCATRPQDGGGYQAHHELVSHDAGQLLDLRRARRHHRAERRSERLRQA